MKPPAESSTSSPRGRLWAPGAVLLLGVLSAALAGWLTHRVAVERASSGSTGYPRPAGR